LLRGASDNGIGNDRVLPKLSRLDALTVNA
jgi:hypothetical protein